MTIKQCISSRGFTLVELMLAMVLGLLIIGGVVSVFLSVKQSYTLNERIARIQENSRIALYLLTSDLKHANFWGNLINVATLSDIPASDMSGTCSDWAKSVAASERFVALNDSALLSFSNCGFSAGDVQTGTSAVALKRVEDNPIDTATGDASIVYLETNSVGGTIAANKAAAPASGFYKWKYAPVLYYVRPGDTSATPPVQPALCRVKGNPALSKECLVEGVEYLHIEYGLDTNNDEVPDEYKYSTTDTSLPAALTSTNVGSAATIKVFFLIRDSEEDFTFEVPTAGISYTLGAKTLGPFTDHYRRTVFSTTIVPHNQRYLPVK